MCVAMGMACMGGRVVHGCFMRKSQRCSMAAAATLGIVLSLAARALLRSTGIGSSERHRRRVVFLGQGRNQRLRPRRQMALDAGTPTGEIDIHLGDPRNRLQGLGDMLDTSTTGHALYFQFYGLHLEIPSLLNV